MHPVHFTDESLFTLRVYRRRGERLTDARVDGQDRFGGGSVKGDNPNDASRICDFGEQTDLQCCLFIRGILITVLASKKIKYRS